jgi:DNA-binding NtrC family response regulator
VVPAAAKPRVLVVDDDDAICKLIETTLEEDGIAALCTTSAEEARRLLDGEALDATVIDMVLRGEPGEQLAAVAQQRGIPVLLISGHPLAIEGHGPQHAFIEKPFRLDDLRAAVRRLLGRAPA